MPAFRRRPARWIAATLAAACVWPVPLAGAAVPPARRAMRFEHLASGEDAPLSVVNCILQDRTGFLWLGTQNGLARYDGYDFAVYRHDPQDPASLAHDWVLALAEDPSGDLWVGTEGGGLSRWRRADDDFVTYRPEAGDPESLSGLRVIALARDTGGALWLGTMDGGLNRFDGVVGDTGLQDGPREAGASDDAGPPAGLFTHFRHDPADAGSLAHDQLGALHVDRSGELWVGTWGGLDRFDPQAGSFVHHRHDPADPSSLADDRVRAIAEDSAGELWVGTLGGLHRLERRTGTFERFLHDPADPSSLSHDWVRALHTDRDGRLWVGTGGGLNLWRPEAGGFAAYLADPGDPTGLRSDQVLALYQDRGGILWLSTVGAGLAKWNPGTWSFSHIRSDSEVAAANMVFSVSEDREGELWIGTFGAGLERLDRATGERVRYAHERGDPGSLADDRVTAMLHDRQGRLWAGTVDGGLSRFDAESGRFEHFRHDPENPDSLVADAVTTLFQDRRGRLWIGTLGGLDFHRGGGVFYHFRHDPRDRTSLGSDRVFALAEDRGGRLWLATDGGGLNRLHPATNAFLRFRHDPEVAGSLASDELIDVHVDAAGRLWIGTKGSGLDLLAAPHEEPGTAAFRNYSRDEGLPDDTVWGIRSDRSGRLWLATNGGLARLDPETGGVKSYTVSHGLQANEFNMGAHHASPSGELFFGGVNGVNAFFPERLEAEPLVPAVVLTSFSRIDQPARLGRPIFELDEIALDHRDYLVSFEVAALDFTAPGENRYRYRLEGLDADWVDLGHRRRMTFTTLAPGRYTLRVQAANHDGVWNREGASLEVAVAPPPWRTWWAYLLYTLAVAAIAGEFVRRQRREVALERANAHRERQIARRERAQSEEHRRLLEELEVKNEELERFNYTVSHDLKSPLVTIKGFLGLLQQDAAAGDADRLRHDVRRIGAAADRMSCLLNELLELSSLGRRVRPPEEVSFAQLASEALENLVAQVAERQVEVVVDPGLPVVVGDRVRLLQLIQNLLANAIKYMGDQRAPRVDFGMRHDAGASDPGETVLYVRDNGVGIDERYHQKVFGLFERLDAGDEGTGVGLALAKRIVEMHGGRIWVESEGLGHGSSFCFTLGQLRSAGGGEAEAGGRVVEAGDRFRRP